MSIDVPAGLDLRIRDHAHDQLKEKTTRQRALVMSLNSAYY
ncbi:hypothetical protein SynBIOSU31_01705 [Synechococcus sp. BIOS-U3-1]|nr:hypothetical protein SynBIOSU31_01705 [Synechococcus sp. BIOS-U3-1]